MDTLAITAPSTSISRINRSVVRAIRLPHADDFGQRCRATKVRSQCCNRRRELPGRQGHMAGFQFKTKKTCDCWNQAQHKS